MRRNTPCQCTAWSHQRKPAAKNCDTRVSHQREPVVEDCDVEGSRRRKPAVNPWSHQRKLVVNPWSHRREPVVESPRGNSRSGSAFHLGLPPEAPV